MAEVFLGLGSNVEPRRHLKAAVQALRERFGDVALSPAYQCPAVGFDGEDFINLCAHVSTELSPVAVAQACKHIEQTLGREHGAPRFSDRTVDIDVLLYESHVGDFGGLRLPREEILEQAYVLRPLSELAPERTHPGSDSTYAELWRAFDGPAPLTPVEL